MTDLLGVENLRVGFPGGPQVLRGFDLAVAPGEAVALVGPSGSGKSLAARAVLGLLPPGAVLSGTVAWKGRRLDDPGGSPWREVRGAGMTLILQEPRTALDPVRTVGDQVAETIRHHRGVGGGEARRLTVDLLAEMELPEPEAVAAAHPHTLSGGQRQRALIAAALACDPELLIADEPTTALDVVVQRGILAVVDRIRRRRGMALLFISHDRDLVDLVADRVVTMVDGRAVAEPAPTESGAVSRAPAAAPAGAPPAVLVLDGVGRVFRRGRQRTAAVAGVDLEVKAGEALGIAGRTGCGKTTLARLMAGHLAPTWGQVRVEGRDAGEGTAAERRQRRRRVQMLFQDPGSSLNPRRTIGEALIEAAGGIGDDPGDRLTDVGLDPGTVDLYPHQLSGGQRQRAALARCLAARPSVVIADEPTSALDHEARDRMLELLAAVRRDEGAATVVISHDLGVLERSCRRIAVMLEGVIVEIYPVGGIGPRHPYARELWVSSPAALRGRDEPWGDSGSGRDVRDVEGDGGCPYQGRCPLWKPRCAKELPPLVEVADGHFVRCPESEARPSSLFIDTY